MQPSGAIWFSRAISPATFTGQHRVHPARLTLEPVVTALRATLYSASPRQLPVQRLQDLALLQLCTIVLALVVMALRG